MDTKLVEAKVCAITEQTPREEMMAVVEMVAALGEIYRQLKKQLDADDGYIAWLEANGDMEWPNGKRDYVGVSKTVKVRDGELALESIVGACGGDIEMVTGYLGSQPWRYGALRELLGPTWDNCFEEIVRKDVKTGAAKKVVKRIDPNFIKPTKG